MFPVIQPEYPDRAGVPPDQIQNQLEGGAFSRAVGADQTRDGSFLHGKAEVLQGETVEFLAQAFDFNDMAHSNLHSAPTHGANRLFSAFGVNPGYRKPDPRPAGVCRTEASGFLYVLGSPFVTGGLSAFFLVKQDDQPG